VLARAVERERAVRVPLAAEAPFEPGGLHLGTALGLVAQVAREVLLERAQGGPCARAAAGGAELGERGAQLRERGVQRVRREPGGARALLQAAQRALQQRVGGRAAAHRLGIGVDPRGAEHALDEPPHAARGERLERAGGLRTALGERR
jgi:hypothetical protein